MSNLVMMKTQNYILAPNSNQNAPSLINSAEKTVLRLLPARLQDLLEMLEVGIRSLHCERGQPEELADSI